ncbi:hypothetical protein IWW45_007428 [Coemansia sp. RSA 485]|nr:hypothetical protein IWW45_007428 [Coemansia sp. RSA 485]
MAISGEEQVPSVNAASSFMLQYGQFEATHKQQLESLGLPKHLWQVLYKKLASEILDIGEYVVLNSVEDSTKHTAYLTEHKLCLSQDKLDAQSNVFLIDHAWTTTIDQALGQLDSAPGLLERMETLTGIFEPHEKMPIMPNTESLDAANEVNVPVVVAQTGVSEEKARELLTKAGGDIIEAIMAASKDSSKEEGKKNSFEDQIINQLGGGSSNSDSNADKPTEWRTREYACSQYALDSGSDKLDGIDISIPVGPSVSKKDVKCSFARRHLEVSVGGSKVLGGDLHAEIVADEATWTLENGVLVVSLVKKSSDYWPAALVGETQINPFVHNKHIMRVFGELWRYFQGYDFLAQNADQSIVKRTNWYIQDEVGLSIGHSDSPNVRCLPFLYLDTRGQMMPFSIMWPTKPISKGDALTRDYCPAWLTDSEQRKGYLQSIFPGPKQFALDAYERMRDDWAQTAKNVVRANFTSLPVPRTQIQRVFVQGATDETAKSVQEAGLQLVENAEQADVVFDDDVTQMPADKQSNQHPLNSVFISTENTLMAFQKVIGMQAWLRPGYHLKTQINEFIGASMMSSNSWWLLTNDQAIPNVKQQKIITNSWVTAVRHADVGYTTAINCTPSAVSPDQLCLAEKIALLTPDNGLYVWSKDTWIYAYPIEQRDNKPEPYQIMADELQVQEAAFVESFSAHFGADAFSKFTEEMERIVSEVMRMMLGIDSSSGKNFGLFSFRFAFFKNEEAGGVVEPCLQSIHPVSVHQRLATDSRMVPSIVATLSGNTASEDWKQIKNA